MLEKKYDFLTIEKDLAARQADCDIIKCDPNSDKKPFTIMMPPPNVTGALHMGHALNYTLQDVMARFKRMCNYDVLWQAGTDHAGIATQMVVEKQLPEGQTRTQLGRTEFLKRVWQWREQYGAKIIEQQKRIGVTADWSRQRFTMDDGLNKSVREIFVRLYKDGLLFRGQRLVNWDSHLLTAVSDLEVEHKENQGAFYYINYCIDGDDNNTQLTVATTRPETMFGDLAIAVHPDDERYQHLIGKYAVIALCNRKILIIADEHCDMEKGTGVVKITPAHDFDDFQVGQRHNLGHINIMNEDATMESNEYVPEMFHGMDRFEARRELVKILKEKEIIVKVETKNIVTPYSDRTGAVIEPRLTTQWFVDAKQLAGKAMDVVKNQDIKFVPAHWDATYFEWMNNIEPWCVSRQIWWGHQIPVWYGPDGREFVATSYEQALAIAQEHYAQQDIVIEQDKDVLDTWFSSGLWPFSTLGWPENTQYLERYYPTDVLVTGFDIIFFWVARMIMFGLYTTGKIPFNTVYINALVRDSKGQKMSKSKGNVIDPLVVIDEYGADALRFTMCALACPGVDLKFQDKQVEGYRNFTTKIWNAARFLEGAECEYDKDFVPTQNNIELALNRSIVFACNDVSASITEHLNNHRFDLAAKQIYQFIWHDFCDWHIEMIKPILFAYDHPHITETRKVVMWVFGRLIHLLHPFMPFITQHLYEQVLTIKDRWLMADSFVQQIFPEINKWQHEHDDVMLLKSLISQIRSLRMQLGVAPGGILELVVIDDKHWDLVNHYTDTIKGMARLITISKQHSDSAIKFVWQQCVLGLEVGDNLDRDMQRKRLQQSLEKIAKEAQQLDKKLGNADFVNKVKPELLAQVREKKQNAQNEIQQLELILKDL